MQIEKMKLADLKPAEYNPRVSLEPGVDEYEKLKRSLLEFGFVYPPIFNKQTGNLVGGHQRVVVAQEIGLCDEIEVSIVDLPLDKEKALNIALNKISGKWDENQLKNLLESLNDDDFELTGFDSSDLESLTGTFSEYLDLEEFYEDVESPEEKTNAEYIVWSDKKVLISKESVEVLNEKLKICQQENQDDEFIIWLMGGKNEIDVS